MKKFILLLFSLSLSIIGASAMNLREAYDALSNLPNVSKVTNDTIHVSIDKVVEYNGIVRTAMAHGLNRTEIFKTGNATLAILNQIPLSYMINGGNNGYVGAFIYSSPNENGSYDLLIVTMSGEQGDLTFNYIPDANENSKKNLTEAKLTMQGASLSIIPQKSDGNVNIGAIKINCD